jgi:hypothetical protein
MGIVTVRCPATGKDVPTGLVMDPDVFRAARLGPRAFVCDACGEPHAWDKSEATVHLDGALVLPDSPPSGR